MSNFPAWFSEWLRTQPPSNRQSLGSTFKRIVRRLIIPSNAGPNDDAIIIGDGVPTEVTAFYAPGTVVGCIVFRDAATDYVYMAFVNPTIGRSFVAFGGIESVGATLSEALRIVPGLGGSILVAEANLSIEKIFGLFGQLELNATSFINMVTPDVRVNGISIPIGVRGETGSFGSSGNIAVETVMFTTPVITFKQGRAYQVKMHCWGLSSTTANIITWRVKRNTGGALVEFINQQRGDNITNILHEGSVIIARNFGAGDLTDALDLTVTPNGVGTITLIGGATFPHYFEVTEVGSLFQYSAAVLI